MAACPQAFFIFNVEETIKRERHGFQILLRKGIKDANVRSSVTRKAPLPEDECKKMPLSLLRHAQTVV